MLDSLIAACASIARYIQTGHERDDVDKKGALRKEQAEGSSLLFRNRKNNLETKVIHEESTQSNMAYTQC